MTQTIYLTTKDFTILEVMLERGAVADPAALRLLRDKILNATVVFADDIPPTVATLNSRVAYRVDGGPTQTHTLVQSARHGPADTLSIATLRGLALIGMKAGDATTLDAPGGLEELRLDTVEHQPEAARGRRRAAPAAGQADVLDLGVFRAARATREREWNDDDPGPLAS